MKNANHVLFEPYRIGNHTLQNRTVVAPLTRRSASQEGIPTIEMAEYYEAFACGGFGMIVTEGTYTDKHFSRDDQYQPGITDEDQMMGWRDITSRVHQYKTLIISQLMHAGTLSNMQKNTIGPSAIQPVGQRQPEPGGAMEPFPLPGPMDVQDFVQVKNDYVHAALRAEKAGFDGVEIHAANGYLFDQFITEHTNTRQDRYGGSVVNRLRFLMEVFEAVRSAVNGDFLVGIRMSESKVNDLTYRWPGGSDTAREIFRELAAIRPSYMHLASEGGKWARESAYADGSSSGSIARQFLPIPIIANGGLHDTALATKLIQEGHADLVSIGRAAIANPDWPLRISTGRPTIPFFKELIKPSLTLAHARQALAAYRLATSSDCPQH